MKKAELITLFDPSNLDKIEESRMNNEFEKKREIYSQYCSVITTSLMFLPDDFDLDDFSSLDGLTTKNKVIEYIWESKPKELEQKLNAVCVEIKTLSRRYVNALKKEKSIAKVYAVKDEWQARKQKKNHIVFCAFIAVTIVFTLGIAVFSILEELAFINFGGKLSSICGVLDFINGAAFFIYEQIDDRKKKEIGSAMNGITGGVFYQGKISATGDNINFGIISNGAEQGKGNTVVYNKNIKVKGTGINLGIKNNSANTSSDGAQETEMDWAKIEEFINKYSENKEKDDKDKKKEDESREKGEDN